MQTDPYDLDSMGDPIPERDIDGAGTKAEATPGGLALTVRDGDRVTIGDYSMVVRKRPGTSKLKLVIERTDARVTLMRDGEIKVGRRETAQ